MFQRFILLRGSFFASRPVGKGYPVCTLGDFYLRARTRIVGFFYLPEQILGNGHCPMGNRDECCVFCEGQYFAPSNSWYVWKLWRMNKRIKLSIVYPLNGRTSNLEKRLGRVKIQDFGFHMQHILRPSSLQCSDGISLLAAPLPSLWPIQAGWA